MSKKILIIEDERSLREALIDILQLRKFQPLSAKNGKEGVIVALKEHPSLILLDLIMPEMDGMATFKKIREDSWGRNVPIIILTNLSENSMPFTTDMISRNLTYYMVKSDWRLHDVVKKIQEIVGV